jgi:hypothetical protein
VSGKSKKHRFRVVLQSAAARNELVRVALTTSSSAVDGYVVEVGPELFLLSVVNDCIVFDGFNALRFDDIKQIWSPAPHHAFVERALSLRKQERPLAPGVDVSSLGALLTSAARAFPLITLHRERVDPDVCQIGRLVVIGERSVTLREISPDATWYPGTESYDLQDITRVDFGCLYEAALFAVNQAP